MALSDRKKGPVAAVSGDKLIVRPRFDDASVLKVTDHRRVADGCESVRDDNRRASTREAAERILNGGLGERIEGARCLVKNKNWGILEEHAGDRDTLRLTAGKPNAALPNGCVEPLRQSFHEIVEVGVFEGSEKFHVVSRRVAQQQVLAD